MLHISNFIPHAIYHLQDIQEYEFLIYQSYKKDREISIQKLPNQLFNVYEKGFSHQQFNNINQKELKKLLKSLQKKEFPRSNQLHCKLYKLPLP